jgi:hypothetical protein
MSPLVVTAQVHLRLALHQQVAVAVAPFLTPTTARQTQAEMAGLAVVQVDQMRAGIQET